LRRRVDVSGTAAGGGDDDRRQRDAPDHASNEYP
jgi:hypothetical protein